MKIKEAQQAYGAQLRAYRDQKNIIYKQQQDLALKMKTEPHNQDAFAGEAAVLELTFNALDEKENEYQKYMDQINEQWALEANLESGRQQGEAAKEYGEELGKLMEVARRLMKGGVVPGSDEKKLMEFSPELYQAAKNIGAMAKRKKEEYDSLWEDEEKTENPDPSAVADNAEAGMGPDMVSVEETMASVAPVEA